MVLGNPNIIVVSGIDTGIGKTTVTGLLARWFKDNGARVITMKMVQTGGTGLSEDIREHRKIAAMEFTEEDAMGLTCPYIFPMACSPHLASRLDGRYINPDLITDSANQLAEVYDLVLLEGAGGLFVPLHSDLLIIDLITQNNWPVILVSGPRTGSINHTIAALDAIKHREIELQGLVYNLEKESGTDQRIIEDSRNFFTEYIKKEGFAGRICDVPKVHCTDSYCVDFSNLFDNVVPVKL
jgi:dethiobiotin synthetase